MANLFARSAQILARTLQRAAGSRAEQRRSGQLLAVLEAVIADVEIETTDEGGFPVRALSTDFLIRTEDLLRGVEPGDRFTVRRGVRTVTYEATHIGKRPCIEPADPHHVQQRIHTKQIRVE